jgi:hypothetical protein
MDVLANPSPVGDDVSRPFADFDPGPTSITGS